MDLSALPVERFAAYLVCLARVGAMVAALPIFGGGTVPGRVRIGLAVMLALIVFPVVEPEIVLPQLDSAVLAVLVGQEAILGMMVGFTAKIILTAVEMGGTIIGYQMGFAAANVYDPQNQRQISLISQFQNIFAILIFLALDIHHVFLRAMVQSYSLIAPGSIDFSGGSIPYLMHLAQGIFVLGVQFSAPVLAVLLLTGLVLGILARVFPQLNVFLLSFPLNIGTAFLVIGLTLNLVALLLSREFGTLEGQLMQLFQTL